MGGLGNPVALLIGSLVGHRLGSITATRRTLAVIGRPARGLYGRKPCPGHGRRAEEIYRDPAEPPSRPEFLPGHCLRNAREPWGADLRRNPLLRHAQQD